MPNMDFVRLHPINLLSQTTASVDFAGKDAVVHAYVSDLADTLLAQETHRTFFFRSKTTEVRASVHKIAKDADYSSAPQTIADRLLQMEKQTQKRYQQITQILKGSLVQASFTADGQKHVLLAKLDHYEFLDEKDLTKRVGLPYEKRVLKACLIPINSNGEFESASVFDTNAKIAEYWWKDFLELQEEKSDEENTKTAFHSVEQFLSKEIGKKSRADYTYLRNDLVSYFRTQQSFRYSHLIETLFGNYTPSVDTINIDDVKKKAKALPKAKKFDQQFDIESGAVKAKYKKIIPLQENLELHLKAEVTDLRHVVEAFEENGIRGIKIKTETGWEQFQRPE